MDLKTTIQYKILNLSYHFTRKDSTELEVLERKVRELLHYLKRKKGLIESFDYLEFVKLLWIMMAETRDIESGKGERELTYMLLLVWYDFFPLLSIWMLKIILGVSGDDCIKGIGCWKDVKHLCHYIREKTGSENHPLILNAVEITLGELHRVVYEDKRSLVVKWIPREKTKYNWLFHLMVRQWFPGSGQPFLYKKKNFRRLISHYNQEFEVLEPLQCSRQWTDIQPRHINTLGLLNKKSLFVGGKDEDDEERKECSQRLNNYLYSDSFFHNIKRTSKHRSHYGMGNNKICKIQCSNIHNIPIGYYVKRAFELIGKGNPEEKEIQLLNQMWAHNLSHYRGLSYFIPVVSLDKFSRGDSFFFSLGLACLLSEKSIIPKRILLYLNDTPHWISLVDCADFYSMMVQFHWIVENLSWGGSTIEAGILMLVQSMLQTQMSLETVEKMVLVAINMAGPSYFETTLHNQIVDVFVKQGIHDSVIPHIVYWNVSLPLDTPLPCRANDARVSVLSGMSSSLIHYFFLFQLKIIRNMNPFEVLSFQINHKKYYPLWILFDKIVDFSARP